MSIRKAFIVIVTFLVFTVYIIPLVPLYSLREFLPGYKSLTFPERHNLVKVIFDFTLSVFIVGVLSSFNSASKNIFYYKLSNLGKLLSLIVLAQLLYLILTRDYSSYGVGQWEYGLRSFMYNFTKIVGNLLALIAFIQYFKFNDKSNIVFLILYLIGFTLLGSRNHFLIFGIVYIYLLLRYRDFSDIFKKGILFLPIFFAINSVKHLRAGVLKYDSSILSFFENFMSSTLINTYFQNGLINGELQVIYFRPIYGALVNLIPTLVLNKDELHRSNEVFHALINGPKNHGIGFSFYAESLWMFGELNIFWIVVCLFLVLRMLQRNEILGLILLGYFSWYFRSDFSGLVKNVVFSYIVLNGCYSRIKC